MEGATCYETDILALLLLDESELEDDDDLHEDPQQPLFDASTSTPTSRQQGGAKPSTTSLSVVSSPCSAEQEIAYEQRRRRRHHRESMARYRKEQRDRVASLHAQETALQKILLQILGHKKYISTDSQWPPQSPLQLYQAKFTELVRTRETLKMENSSLHGSLLVHDQRMRAFQSISQQISTPSIHTSSRVNKTLSEGGTWVQYEYDRDDDAPFYYRPVNAQACRATIARALHKMATLLTHMPSSQATVTSVPMMGWMSQRGFTSTVEGGVQVMLFRFSKLTRTRVTRAEMAAKSWQIYSNPQVMARASASSVHAQVVQQVDDDIVVIVRNAPGKRQKTNKYLSVYHKMPSSSLNSLNGSGRDCTSSLFTMLISRGLHDNTTQRSSSCNWLKDGCALLRFHELATPAEGLNAGGGEVEVEYMGYLECHDRAHGDQMWAELCLLMLLWENTVIPQNLLQLG